MAMSELATVVQLVMCAVQGNVGRCACVPMRGQDLSVSVSPESTYDGTNVALVVARTSQSHESVADIPHTPRVINHVQVCAFQ